MKFEHIQLQSLTPRNKKPGTIALFFHGFPGNFTKNEDLAFDLATERRIETTLVTYRGVGPRPGNFSFTGVMDDIEALFKQLTLDDTIDTIYLCAHSWGGTSSLQAVTTYPDKVKKIIYLAPMLRWPGQALINSIIEDMHEKQISLIGCEPNKDNLIAESIAIQSLQESRLLKLAQTQIPIQIFHGEKDDVIDIALSQEFVSNCDSANLHTTPCGHYLEDRPTIRSLFLQKVPG